jgi:hypothetical protein
MRDGLTLLPPRFILLSEQDLARIPGEVDTSPKGFAPITMLEQILIAKVFNFGGICPYQLMLQYESIP